MASSSKTAAIVVDEEMAESRSIGGGGNVSCSSAKDTWNKINKNAGNWIIYREFNIIKEFSLSLFITLFGPLKGKGWAFCIIFCSFWYCELDANEDVE